MTKKEPLLQANILRAGKRLRSACTEEKEFALYAGIKGFPTPRRGLAFPPELKNKQEVVRLILHMF